MHIIQTAADLDAHFHAWREADLEWAFVPTMGALHEGHLSLVRYAKAEYSRVVVSVFVNPTQFDRREDLARYPRQLDQDAQALRSAGVDVLFAPSAEEIYPQGQMHRRRAPDLDGLDKPYEGAARPGHFDGVVQVVRRLVELVQPTTMYMGQKDAQQVAVLQRAARQEFWMVKIKTVPIVREVSGLAMSSRNGQLSPAGLRQASQISRSLAHAANGYQRGERISELQQRAHAELIEAGLKPEYFDFVDPRSFQPLSQAQRAPANGDAALIIAVAWCEGVRLIDNWSVEPQPQAPDYETREQVSR